MAAEDERAVCMAPVLVRSQECKRPFISDAAGEAAPYPNLSNTERFGCESPCLVISEINSEVRL